MFMLLKFNQSINFILRLKININISDISYCSIKKKQRSILFLALNNFRPYIFASLVTFIRISLLHNIAITFPTPGIFFYQLLHFLLLFHPRDIMFVWAKTLCLSDDYNYETGVHCQQISAIRQRQHFGKPLNFAVLICH